jgi:hypothetical protein
MFANIGLLILGLVLLLGGILLIAYVTRDKIYREQWYHIAFDAFGFFIGLFIAGMGFVSMIIAALGFFRI